MRRRLPGLGAVLAAAGLLQGCATAKPVAYGPIGPEAPYGYREVKNQDGGFAVLVVMPGYAAPDELRIFFDRRAGELCPAGVARTNVFRMTRDDYTYVNYGSTYPSTGSRIWTGAQLEGYVYCRPDPDAPTAASETD